VQSAGNGTLDFMLSDHLGSTSITTDSSGNVVSQLKYSPWGGVHYTSGSSLTNYTYTGQYSNMADFGLMFYNARFYDPYLGRFAQADSVVPSGVQGYDRYAYVNNLPINNTDPTGHRNCTEDGYDCYTYYSWVAASPAPSSFANSNPTPSAPVATSTPQPSLSASSNAPTTTAPNLPEFVAVATPPGTPVPQSPAWLSGEDVSNILDWASTGYGLGGDKALNLWEEDPLVGPFLDGYSQMSNDSGKGYTESQVLARAATKAGEGWVSETVGGGAFALTVAGGGGPEDLIADAAGVLVYLNVTKQLGNGFDAANEKWLYPLYNKLP